uniref:F-box protein n=1 Tax=Chenopodium quinoa TaxID=63459 RepID=A0A803L2X6_CHEQI
MPCFDSTDNVHMFLGLLDGSLCLSVSAFNIGTSFWVMKEYGAAGSWTKLFSIPKFYGYAGMDRPISYSMSLKEVFVHLSFSLVATVDLDTMEISIVKQCGNAHVCVQNLLML